MLRLVIEGPGFRNRVVVVLATLTVVAFAAVAAIVLLDDGSNRSTSDQAPRASSDPTENVSDESLANPLELCGSDGVVECVSIRKDRVAVIYRANGRRGDSSGIVLWNPGGPGLTPPPTGVREVGLPAAFSNYDLLYLVEPWNVETPSGDCLDDSGRRGYNCDYSQLSWDSADVEAVIDKAEKVVHAPLVGAYGTSFGATAVAPLVDELASKGGWVVLENPAPPAGTSIDMIVNARAEAVKRFVAQWGGCDAEAACFEERMASISTWSTHAKATGQSRDFDLGLVALSTDPGSNSKFLDGLVERIDHGLALTAGQQRALRRAGARFQLRGSGVTVQPALVGLWAGTCIAYGEAGDSVEPGIAQSLAHLYRGCRDRRANRVDVRSSTSNVLIIHGKDDTVVPIELQKVWETNMPNATSVVVEGNHFRESGEISSVIGGWLENLSP